MSTLPNGLQKLKIGRSTSPRKVRSTGLLILWTPVTGKKAQWIWEKTERISNRLANQLGK